MSPRPATSPGKRRYVEYDGVVDDRFRDRHDVERREYGGQFQRHEHEWSQRQRLQLTNTATSFDGHGHLSATGGGITVNNTGALTTSGAIQDNTAGNTISLEASSGTLTVLSGATVTGTLTDTINLTTVTSGNIAVNGAVCDLRSGMINVTSSNTATSGLVSGGTLSTTGVVDSRFRHRHDLERREYLVGSFQRH